MPTPVLSGTNFIVNTGQTSGTQDSGAVTCLKDGRAVVVWRDGVNTLKFKVLNADGTTSVPDSVLNTGQAGTGTAISPTVTALANGGFAVAWDYFTSANANSRDIFYKVYDSSITAVTGNNPAHTVRTGNQIEPDMAATDTGFVISWTEDNLAVSGVSTNSAVMIRGFDSDGVATGAASRVSDSFGGDFSSAIAYGSGHLNTVWDDNLGQVLANGENEGIFGLENGILFPLGNYTASATTGGGDGKHQQPDIAYSGGSSFGVVFAFQAVPGGETTIATSFFGLLPSGQGTANTSTLGSSFLPSVTGIAGSGNYFLVVWHDGGSASYGSDHDILGQLYDGQGIKIGDEFAITSSSISYTFQSSVSLTNMADGRFLIVFSAGGPSSSGGEVYAQFVDPRDTGQNWSGTTLNDQYVGTAFADTVVGEGGQDRLSGMDGDDAIRGGGGFDTIDGGNGVDRISYWDSVGVTLTLGEGGAGSFAFTGLNAFLGTDFYSGIEGIDGSEFDADNLTGNSAGNILYGFGGNDTLSGLGGADTLYGNLGTDVLDGGTGADSLEGGADGDFYYVDNAGDVITELAGEGFDYAYSSVSFTQWANVEYILATGAAALTGTGDGGVNAMDATSRFNVVTFNGLGGGDVLYGSNYADTLDGGADADIIVGYYSVGGVDSLIGGAGDDVYYVYEADDLIVELAGEGIDTLYAYAPVTLALNVEQVLLVGTGTSATGNAQNNNIFGNNLTTGLTLDGQGGADWIIGGAGADTLIGGAGNDQLQGLGGANRMEGGADNDQFYSTSASDTIIELAGGGFDTLFASYNVVALAGEVEQLVILGGATVANGNGLGNGIYANNNTAGVSADGGAGHDIIYGSGLADTLIGGFGNDTMLGLAGADRFAYSAAGNMGSDLIDGFEDGTDFIVLTGMGYSPVAAIGVAITIGGGANALVTFASGSLAGTTITLLGVNQASISAADFVF